MTSLNTTAPSISDEISELTGSKRGLFCAAHKKMKHSATLPVIEEQSATIGSPDGTLTAGLESGPSSPGSCFNEMPPSALGVIEQPENKSSTFPILIIGIKDSIIRAPLPNGVTPRAQQERIPVTTSTFSTAVTETQENTIYHTSDGDDLMFPLDGIPVPIDNIEARRETDASNTQQVAQGSPLEEKVSRATKLQVERKFLQKEIVRNLKDNRLTFETITSDICPVNTFLIPCASVTMKEKNNKVAVEIKLDFEDFAEKVHSDYRRNGYRGR